MIPGVTAVAQTAIASVPFFSPAWRRLYAQLQPRADLNRRYAETARAIRSMLNEPLVVASDIDKLKDFLPPEVDEKRLAKRLRREDDVIAHLLLGLM